MASKTTLPETALGLRARGVSVRAAEKALLEDVDLDVLPGELCAVIGVSGSGKSTLLRALAGVSLPAAGHVSIDGAPAIQRTDLVGYVPFGDLVHPQLTVREALTYAAALRLPKHQDRDERIDVVIDELRMAHHADSLVGSLSDGERRRVACGTELVGDPRALVLDEPTTGLDPDLQRRLMRFLRSLADSGLAVVVSTHATASLDLCDRLAVMRPGGQISFTGTPEEVLVHFDEVSIDGVYDDVHQEPGERRPARPSEPLPAAAMPPLPPLLVQIRTLAARYATCLGRQPRSLAILIGQAPLIGLAIAVVMPTTVVQGGGLTSFYSVLIAFVAVISAIWLGLVSSCREIAGELEIVRRESAIGVRLDAYVLSKCAVLLPIAAIQVVLLILPLVLLQPFGSGVPGYLSALPILIAAGWTGVMIGLAVSALVRTAGQATAAVPLVMIPQLLLAGALIPQATMVAPIKLLSDLTVSRWALGGVGTAFRLDVSVSGDLGGVTGLDSAFFALSPGIGMGVLLAACVLGFVVTTLALGYRLDDETPAALRD